MRHDGGDVVRRPGCCCERSTLRLKKVAEHLQGSLRTAMTAAARSSTCLGRHCAFSYPKSSTVPEMIILTCYIDPFHDKHEIIKQSAATPDDSWVSLASDPIIPSGRVACRTSRTAFEPRGFTIGPSCSSKPYTRSRSQISIKTRHGL